MNSDRYRLTLVADDRPTLQGWRESETVARRKFSAWVGHGNRHGAQITLIDEETDSVLRCHFARSPRQWPSSTAK
ncbi:hypothetical protein [Streptomyces olivaceus]|uniref:hypothetical protein n=1 Tax=Streptomyces olivaceus TaxID=47716 RepID=UPI003658FBDD